MFKSRATTLGIIEYGTDVTIDIEDAEQVDGGWALRDIDGPESQLMTEQLRQAIEEAMRRLPEDLRVALTLREFDGLSYEEIAEAMQCPVGTVRSRIFRAREAVDADTEALHKSVDEWLEDADYASVMRAQPCIEPSSGAASDANIENA